MMPPVPRRDIEPDDEAAELFRPRSSPARAAVPCPPPELVQASLAGILPSPLQERVATHVEGCVVCQTLAEALDHASVGPLTQNEQERIGERVRTELSKSRRDPGRRRWWVWSAAAAIVLAAIGATLVWQSQRPPADPRLAQGTRDTDPPAGQSAFQLEKPDLRERRPTTPLGQGATPSAEGADLNQALEPYRTNDFPEVARRMTALIARYPQSASGYLHLGVSGLFLNRDPDAVTSLETAERLAKDDPRLALEASWYLALAYYRTGKVDQARARLDALCRGGSLRSARACAGLQELAAPVHASGLVTGPGGVLLPGAIVGEYMHGRMEGDYGVAVITQFRTITDDGGRYSISGHPIRRLKTIGLRVSKSGYFSRVKNVPVSPDMQVDFVLDPWVHISLGEIVRGTMKAGDPFRRFAVTVPASGTLEVSLATPNPADFYLHVEIPSGDVYGPREGLPIRVAIPVVASSTYQIAVEPLSESPRFFQLTTRLR